MNTLKLDDNTISNILINTKTIAVVGHSDKPERTSYQIAQFLCFRDDGSVLLDTYEIQLVLDNFLVILQINALKLCDNTVSIVLELSFAIHC